MILGFFISTKLKIQLLTSYTGPYLTSINSTSKIKVAFGGIVLQRRETHILNEMESRNVLYPLRAIKIPSSHPSITFPCPNEIQLVFFLDKSYQNPDSNDPS
jgi:hypothetical protein